LNTAFNDAERLLNIASRYAKKQALKVAKEQACEAKKVAKEQACEAKKVAKEKAFEAKEAKKNEKIKQKKLAWSRMRCVGEMLMNEFPDGFTSCKIIKKYIEVHGHINVWNGQVNGDDYDTGSGVRSLLGEMSPSSAQHWFKYGIGRDSNEIAPWAFVNKRLALVNDKYEWKITTSGTGRTNKKEKGNWIYVPLLVRRCWSEKYGPLPTEEMLTNARLGRKIGVRGSKVSVQNLLPE
jgi:hypothetical protein